MLSCKDLAQRYSSDHLDGELRGGVRWSVRLHLLLCGHCRQFMRQLAIAKILLRRPINNIDMNDHEVSAIANKLSQLCKHHEH